MDNEQNFKSQNFNWTPSTDNGRELGALMMQMEYLKDAIKTAQIEITNSLLERKDLHYALERVNDRCDDLVEHIKCTEEKLETELNNIGAKLSKHIQTDIGFSEFLTTKIGKLVIAGILALGGMIGLAVANGVIQPIIDKIFRSNRTTVVAEVHQLPVREQPNK